MNGHHQNLRTEEEFESYGTRMLRDSGFKLTRQRAAILDLFARKRTHCTPQEVYGLLKDEVCSLSLATVYNTLEVFEEVGLLRRFTSIDGQTYFDANLKPHHHACCEKCGTIFDLAVPSDLLDSLKKSTKTSSPVDGDFSVEVATVWFRGICAECRNK